MALEDRYGLPLSTASPEAASAYREGVDLMLAGWTGTAYNACHAMAASSVRIGTSSEWCPTR